jgi:hypothetical protein
MRMDHQILVILCDPPSLAHIKKCVNNRKGCKYLWYEGDWLITLGLRRWGERDDESIVSNTMSIMSLNIITKLKSCDNVPITMC